MLKKKRPFHNKSPDSVLLVPYRGLTFNIENYYSGDRLTEGVYCIKGIEVVVELCIFVALQLCWFG